MLLYAIIKMDVLNVLVNNMDYIINEIYSNVGTGDDDFMEELYKIVNNNINIHFDNRHFYFLEYKLIGKNKIFFRFNEDYTPKSIIEMVLDLINHKRMDENIKNKNYNIHFRVFKEKVALLDKENTIRCNMFLSAYKVMNEPYKLRIFLMKKLLMIKSAISKFPSDFDLYVNESYIIKCIIKALDANVKYNLL